MTAAKSKYMRTRKQKRNASRKVRRQRLGVIAAISFVAILSLMSVKFLDNWGRIQERKEEIIRLEQEYNHRRINNEALQQQLDTPVDEEYIIEAARKYGYRKSDEILFYLNDGE